MEYISAKTIATRIKSSEWFGIDYNMNIYKARFSGQGLAERCQKHYKGSYECRSPRAASLWKLFTGECETRGILWQMKDIIHGYKKNHEVTQLSLFD